MDKTTWATINYIFIIIQFITIIALIIGNNLINIDTVILFTVLFIIYIYLEKRYFFYVSNYIHACLALVIIAHCFGGKLLNLYVTSTTFDKYLHIFGTYTIALFAYSITKNIMEIPFNSKANIFLHVTLLGVSCGTIFELIEYIGDLTLKPSIPNQNGLIDTDLDMVANLLGALIAAWHASYIGVKLKHHA